MSNDAPNNSSSRKRRAVQFGEGVVEATSADEAANSDLWRSIRRILVPALIGAGYAVYRLFTAN